MCFFDPPQTARIYEQCIHRPLRKGRQAGLKLDILVMLTTSTIEEGRHHASWAKSSIGTLLLPDQSTSDASADDDIKRRLLEGRLYGVRWHAMGVEPPTGQTRNLSDRLPLLIAELQRGNRKFDDEEWAKLAGDVQLQAGDYVCASADADTYYVPTGIGAGALAPALAELVTFFTMGLASEHAQDANQVTPWSAAAAMETGFSALKKALSTEARKRRHEKCHERRETKKKQEALRRREAVQVPSSLRSGAAFRPGSGGGGSSSENNDNEALRMPSSLRSGAAFRPGSGGGGSSSENNDNDNDAAPQDDTMAPEPKVPVPRDLNSLNGMFVRCTYDVRKSEWKRDREEIHYGVISAASSVSVKLYFPLEERERGQCYIDECPLEAINSPPFVLVDGDEARRVWAEHDPPFYWPPSPVARGSKRQKIPSTEQQPDGSEAEVSDDEEEDIDLTDEEHDAMDEVNGPYSREDRDDWTEEDGTVDLDDLDQGDDPWKWGSSELDEVNLSNLKLMDQAIKSAKRRNKSCNVSTLYALELDLVFTQDDAEISLKRALTREEIVRFSPVALQHRSLKARIAGKTDSNNNKRRVVPQGISLLRKVEIFEGLRATFPCLKLLRCRSSEDDNFETIFVRLPPTSTRTLPASSSLAFVPNSIFQIWKDAVKPLRNLLFEIWVADLYSDPAKRAAQFFVGWDANVAKERCILAVAYGVTGGGYVGGVKHRPHELPTLLSRDYVEAKVEGAHRVGAHVNQLAVPQHRHDGRRVTKGPYTGGLVSEVFAEGLETLFEG